MGVDFIYITKDDPLIVSIYDSSTKLFEKNYNSES